MIVLFALDPTSLLDETPRTLVKLKRIQSLWDRVGALAIPEPALRVPFVKIFEKLPVSVRKQLQVALKEKRTKEISGFACLSEITDIASLQALTALDLVCVDEVRALFYGMSEGDQLLVTETGLEICLLDAVDQSQRFLEALALGDKPLLEGELVSSLWKDRFVPLLDYCKEVVIVDRYAMSKSGRAEGALEQFLQRIDSVGPPARKVTIFCSAEPYDEHYATSLAEQLLTAAKSRGGLRELELNLISDFQFSKVSHGRYFRLGRSVLEVDVGLELFQGKAIWRDCQFSLKTDYRDRRAKERRLLDHAFLQGHRIA